MEYTVKELLSEVNTSYKHPGDERIRAITEHVIEAIYATIVKFDVTHEEVWQFQSFLNKLGQANQVGLLGAGIGIERLLDILADEKDKSQGILGSTTPRAIEGPLFIEGAPQSVGFAVMNTDNDIGTPFLMEGVVRDTKGNPVAGAVMDIWMANSNGAYSIIDSSQTPFNNRRKVVTDANGHYAFKGLIPPGYSVPPGSPTQRVLDLLGREGHRPGHIHFMIKKAGLRPLTTQVNIPGDKYLNEDFAFATRDELIVEMKDSSNQDLMKKYGFDGKFTHIEFNFNVLKE